MVTLYDLNNLIGLSPKKIIPCYDDCGEVQDDWIVTYIGVGLDGALRIYCCPEKDLERMVYIKNNVMYKKPFIPDKD